MATSGTAELQYTRDNIIDAALRKLSVLAKGQTPEAQDYTDATVALNMLVAELRSLQGQIWKRTTHTFSPTSGTQSYNIGTGQTLNTPYPIHLIQCLREETTGGAVIDMDIETDYNFNMLPGATTGIPIKVTYQPKINFGTIKFWPIPDDASEDFEFTLIYQEGNDYFTASGNTADFPEEWYMALVYQLAYHLAPEWGIALPDQQELSKRADKALARVLENGSEDGSVFFQPDWRR